MSTANYFKTALLLGLLTALIIAVGGSLGGRQGMIIALVFAGVMNFVSYWFSDKIVLKMYRAQPVGPEHPLYRTMFILEKIPQIPSINSWMRMGGATSERGEESASIIGAKSVPAFANR